jgi:MFS family permease
MSSIQFGLVEAMLSGGMMAGAILLSFQKETKKKLQWISKGLILLTVCYNLIGLPTWPFMSFFSTNGAFTYYSILLLIMGMIVISIQMPITIMIQRQIPEHALGRVYGIFNTIVSAIQPLGVLIFGLLTDIFPSYVIMTAAGFTLLLIIGFSLRKLDSNWMNTHVSTIEKREDYI